MIQLEFPVEKSHPLALHFVYLQGMLENYIRPFLELVLGNVPYFFKSHLCAYLLLIKLASIPLSHDAKFI